VERAVTGLLRICQRLLPYKEDTAETLLRSLKLAIGLSPNVAWELAERIAAEVRGWVGGWVGGVGGWVGVVDTCGCR
jgi:brefeldin A-resistance guanine nucleotide exchange factor 1